MKGTEGRVGLNWKRSPLLVILSYALLIAGGLVCFVPFVWMVSASAKVDREIYAQDRMSPPRLPNSFPSSPFLDKRHYIASGLNITEDELAVCRKLIDNRSYRFPQGVDIEVAKQLMALGHAIRLAQTLPEELRKKGGDVFQQSADTMLTPPALEQLFDDIYRRLEFGELIIKSHDQRVQVLGEEIPIHARFKILTPEVVSMTEENDLGTSCALVKYDFSKGDVAIFQQSFRSDFDLRTLRKIQLGIRPDDNWQRLHLTVEMLGGRYEAVRELAMSNFDWASITWQEPGPDDESTRIRNWILLNRVADDAAISNDPHDLTVTLRLKRSGPIQACWDKMTLNYRTTGQYIPFFRYLWNTTYLVTLNVLLMLISCSIIAYGLTRVAWPGREFVFILLLATMMVPAQVTMIPGFLIWKNLGFYNTMAPLWLGTAFGNAFNIFLLRQFMRGIPRDIEDAAKIDGCGIIRVFWHIILPLVRPTLAAIALFTIVGTWNDFKGPLLFLADQRLYPIAFGLYAFSVQVTSNPAQTMAASVLMAFPILALFFFAQRHFISGVTLTSGK